MRIKERIAKEDRVMKQIISSQLIDYSDDERFCFALHCQECGTEWKSTPIRFSKAGVPPLSEAKRVITETLYHREHAQAKTHAINEAVHHFNNCPLCGKLVCNYCFVICDDLDMCHACSVRLQETGVSVMDSLSDSIAAIDKSTP